MLLHDPTSQVPTTNFALVICWLCRGSDSLSHGLDFYFGHTVLPQELKAVPIRSHPLFPISIFSADLYYFFLSISSDSIASTNLTLSSAMATEFDPTSMPISTSGSRDRSGPSSGLIFGTASTADVSPKAAEQSGSQQVYKPEKSSGEQVWQNIVRNFTPS
jgi:hypothetical protein